MKVAVCIPTYLRPEGLRRLLAGLDRLVFDKCEAPLLRIVVVDNDAAGSASAVCQEMRSEVRWPIEYHIEPRRGISQVRNTAVECAKENSDFVAFVDDDEVPEPNWLDELLFVQRSYTADVVSGPVPAYFFESTPRWVVKGKFFEQGFERPRYPTGHPIELTGAGNVLVRSEVFEEMETIFDERLALTGCEDAHFFARVHRAGYRMVWADEAVAHEWTPASRANVGWILKRSYSFGNSLSLCERYLSPSPGVRAARLVKGCGRIVQGLMLLLPSLLLGKAALIRALQHVCRGAGALAGLSGVHYEEYK